jgi:phage baseplate assembly protein W
MPDRLAWPLRVVDGRLATVEQDSPEDIQQCLKAILLTRIGERPDLPEMGCAELVFGEQPLELDAIREVLARHEPRAAVLATTHPDLLDAAIAEIRLEWEPTDA